MSKIIKPWSQLSTEAQVTQNQTNYPSCLSFFQMKGLEPGDGGVKDIITGGVYAHGTLTDDQANGGVNFGPSVGSVTTTVPYADIDDGYAVFILALGTAASGQSACGYGDMKNFAFPYLGYFNNLNYGCGGGADASNYEEKDVNAMDAPPQVLACTLAHDGAGTNYVYFTDDTVVPKRNAMTDAAGSFTDITWDSSADFYVRNVTVASCALFLLPFEPTENEMYAIVEWTKYHHLTANNKVICPYFYGLPGV